MIFGARKKKAPLWVSGSDITPLPNITAGGGIGQSDAEPEYGKGVGLSLDQQEQPPQKQGFGTRILGEGWEDKVSALGSLIAGDGGRGIGQYHQRNQAAQQQQQQRAMVLADEQRKRAQGMADWESKKQWELDNPAPQAPTAQQRNFDAYKNMTPEEQGKFTQYLDAVTPKLITGDDGRVYPARQSPPRNISLEEFDKAPSGEKAAPKANNFKGDYASFRAAIIQQESGGRYGVANAEGSGAMGLGQIMPETAKALARKNGLPYRPDLLAGKSKAAQQYQQTLTTAATKEAWKYGGGDIRKAAGYYFAGPNKAGWKRKTNKYQSDIFRRMGGR